MMTLKEFCSKVDYSYLGWICEKSIVRDFCEKAVEYGFASVCVNPDQVKYAASLLKGRAGISCVCGFPCGANSAEIKIAEACEAIDNGATDVDIVSNLSMIRNNETELLAEEYRKIVTAIRRKSPKTVIKFIIYAPYGTNPCFDDIELKTISELVLASGADYIKFVADPDVIKKFTGDRIKMKFSGCSSFDVTLDAVLKGCDRVGCDENIVPWIEEHRYIFEK